MRTIGLKPGDRVLLIERVNVAESGGPELVHNGLVISVSMRADMRGKNGEMPISVVWVSKLMETTLVVHGMPHISHHRWRQGLISMAYEELPPQTGVCRFCGCTERRACVDANGDSCSWIDADRTVCSAARCLERATEADLQLFSLNVEGDL